MKSKPSPAVPTISSRLRRYLYFTAGVTGGAIMVIEILGAKMLSPYLGLSHFVWTAQIAVTLVALACGYYVGGRWADRSQKLSRLYGAILVAAVYLAVTVLICEPVAYWCLDFSLPVGSLLASTILFFLPLALLAVTGPFLVRVISSSLTGVGGNMGRLTAISTLGSFAGTILIGYLMIPLFPNSVIMYATAGILVLVCMPYFLIYRREALAAPAMALLFMALLAIPLGSLLSRKYEHVRQIFCGNSYFGQLQVVDLQDGSERYYMNDFLIQNTFDPERKQSMSHFTYMLSGLARAYTTNIGDVLCIGLGVGVVPMDFANHGAQVDVVEINPAVVPVAVRYFDLQTNKLNLTIDDGRHFLNRCRKKYDAVILDAFLGDSSPSHLFSREAFDSVRRALRPGGVVVMNVFGNIEPGFDFFLASLNKTLKAVFGHVRIHTSGDGGMFLVASERGPLEFVRPPQFDGIHPAVIADTRTSYIRTVETSSEDGIVLTDNFNPAEYHDARNRENVRRALAQRARGM